MRHAHYMYEDVIDALNAAEVPAFVTQTGGMCLAIEIKHPRGWFWLTDREDSLSWDREPGQGWALGFYLDDSDFGDCAWDDLLVRETKDVESAVSLVMEGIRKAAET